MTRLATVYNDIVNMGGKELAICTFANSKYEWGSQENVEPDNIECEQLWTVMKLDMDNVEMNKEQNKWR